MAARSILHALDMKDHYTFGHSMRVTYFALNLGRSLGLNENELYTLELATLFHDIGKIGVPDKVLLKPERLTTNEFELMAQHPVNSAEILSGFSDFEKVAKYARHHHERIDGNGYPDKLAGENIPFYSRIILIADTFDAMVSTRPYRKGLPYSRAFQELQDFSGSQFDSYLVKSFIKTMSTNDVNKTDKFYIPIMKDHFDKDAA